MTKRHSANVATKTRHSLPWLNMLSWRMYDVEGFIEAVKARPALYNSKHQHFNRKDVRARLWDEIGRIMYPEWDNFDERDKNEKGSFMQKKWKSLKDCFNREVRLQKTQNPNRLRKKYEFYDRLSFLLQKTNPESPKSVVTEIKIEEQQQQQPETTPESSKSLPFQEVTKKRKSEMKDFIIKPKQIRISDESDSDRLFLMSFINDFKMLPLATKYWVKMKFSEVMHQAAMSLEEFQEVGSPVTEFLAEGSSPDSSSSEVFICQR